MCNNCLIRKLIYGHHLNTVKPSNEKDYYSEIFRLDNKLGQKLLEFPKIILALGHVYRFVNLIAFAVS